MLSITWLFADLLTFVPSTDGGNGAKDELTGTAAGRGARRDVGTFVLRLDQETVAVLLSTLQLLRYTCRSKSCLPLNPIRDSYRKTRSLFSLENTQPGSSFSSAVPLMGLWGNLERLPTRSCLTRLLVTWVLCHSHLAMSSRFSTSFYKIVKIHFYFATRGALSTCVVIAGVMQAILHFHTTMVIRCALV